MSDPLQVLKDLLDTSERMLQHVPAPTADVREVVECPHCHRVWTQEEQRDVFDWSVLHTRICPWMKWKKAIEAGKAVFA